MRRAILVVDPDTNHRARLRTLLAAIHSRVIGEASDPEEAMRQAVMTTPDLAIVAAELASGDGIHLASRLATEHGVPSVLLSPPLAPMEIERAAQAGVMGMLVKPVYPSILRGMLEVAICRFQEMSALRREAEALRRTLENRKLIERAKGLLMEMKGIPEQEAFAHIRQKSMNSNRTMAERARAVILAAEIDGSTR